MINKSELRKHYAKLRNSLDISHRRGIDGLIANNLINSELYRQSDTLLIYVSVGNEIETKDIILNSLSDGKKVAVPFCTKNKMYFYEISSLDDLSEIQFGIPTVDINCAKKVILTENTLCIVPAYAFDFSGFRLGYGGGYYDRFLADNKLLTVGLCRKQFLVESLPREEHDIRVKNIVTEDKIIII